MRAATGICLLGVIIGLMWPATGHADGLPIVDLSSDPWYVGWSSLLPPGYLGDDTDSSDACVAGRIACVTKFAGRLEQQVSNLGCNHDAVFSLAYARTTEKIKAVEKAQPALLRGHPVAEPLRRHVRGHVPERLELVAALPHRAARLGARVPDRGSEGRLGGGQPAARHERPRQPRPALHAVRDRPRGAGRLLAQARPRRRQPDPRHGHHAAARRDRGQVRPERARRAAARCPNRSTTSSRSRCCRSGARRRGTTPSRWPPPRMRRRGR